MVFFLYIFGGIYRAPPTEKGTGQYSLNYSETQERGTLGELRGFKVKWLQPILILIYY